MKRTGKEYRKIEKDVMEMLGLRPTKNSGSGWVEKEDGENEHVLCQLKSTDAGSIKVSKQDLDTLQYNAIVSHKLPVFAIQFLQSNEVYLVINPELLGSIESYLKTGEVQDMASGIDLSECEDMTVPGGRIIKSNYEEREMYNREQKEKYKRKRRLDG